MKKHVQLAMYKKPVVNIIGRRNGIEDNLFCVSVDAFDASAYVDYIRKLLNDDNLDYIIVEPAFASSILF